jgi:hypothetical protein
MLARRKLLVGAGALLASNPARAAFFQGAINGLGPSLSPSPQVAQLPKLIAKPTGTPAIDRNNELNNGLLYYGFDTGLGYVSLLADCPGDTAVGGCGHGMFLPLVYGVGQPGGVSATTPSGQFGRTTTRYGTGFKYLGLSAESGTVGGPSSWVWDNDALRSAINLWNSVAGIGFTIASVFVPFAAADVSIGQNVIFGRTAQGFTEVSPAGASVCLSFDTSSRVVLFYYDHTNTAPHASTIVSSAVSLNVQHTAVATFLNTSSGSATATLYVDGLVAATATGVALADTLGAENTEGQVQFGSSWHVFANHVSNVFNGQVFSGSMYKRAWNAKEVAAFNAAPWSQLKSKGLTS